MKQKNIINSLIVSAVVMVGSVTFLGNSITPKFIIGIILATVGGRFLADNILG